MGNRLGLGEAQGKNIQATLFPSIFFNQQTLCSSPEFSFPEQSQGTSRDKLSLEMCLESQKPYREPLH